MDGAVFEACSYASAGIGGVAAYLAFSASRKRQRQRRDFTAHAMQIDVVGTGFSCDGVAARVLDLARKVSRQPPRADVPRALEIVESIGSDALQALSRTAGLETAVTVSGLCRTRARLAVGSCLAGALIGAVASDQLAILLGAIGAAAGWLSVRWALKQESNARKARLERHLSELIEVVCLGLRSGLSFDRALTLYCDCFSGSLGAELRLAQGQWFAGLRTRDEALHALSRTYDSVLFERMVENIVRSMRFGSPLADGLEVLAAEARQAHKAHVEEKVMKAPVKMMVPVGTLILPSMLILVLGPVLLDLINGI